MASVLKESKEKSIPVMTKKQATRGKLVKLHKYWKGIASSIIDKKARRQYINMMLDATVSEIEAKNKKKKERETSGEE